MTALVYAAFLALGSAMPAPASADGVRITGRTRADAALAQSAVQEIARFTPFKIKCDRLESVEASVMPKGWQPADPNFRIAPRGARYEKWNVSMCGRVEPFLVAFWKEKKAGKQFQVGHPFPADPPKPGKP